MSLFVDLVVMVKIKVRSKMGLEVIADKRRYHILYMRGSMRLTTDKTWRLRICLAKRHYLTVALACYQTPNP